MGCPLPRLGGGKQLGQPGTCLRKMVAAWLSTALRDQESYHSDALEFAAKALILVGLRLEGRSILARPAPGSLEIAHS